MIKPNKVLGGNFFGYHLNKAYQQFIKQVIHHKPWAFIRNASNGKDVTDRLDTVQLDIPIVTLSNITVTQATLNWQEIPNANGYRIDPLGVSVVEPTFQLTGLSGGSETTYTVVAVGDGDVTSTSSPIIVRTKLSAVGGVSTENVTSNSFLLRWTGLANTNYVIEKARQADYSDAEIVTVFGGSAGANAFTVYGLTAETLWRYRIKAIRDGFPDSNYTNGSITTTAA